MINGKILFNSATWSFGYHISNMTPLRGHKYHILPTSSSPLTVSLAILLLLLSFVFSFHGATTTLLGFDTIIQAFSNLFSREIFHRNLLDFFLLPLRETNSFLTPELDTYKNIHIFWLAPFALTLGFFLLWSSNAIEEGTTTKISFFSFSKNIFDVASKPIVEPMFHSNLVRKGFKIGFILFIISEIMFFFGFFWAFFHSSVSPTIQIGAVWPPLEVEFITVKGFAVANTVILLTSGATLTIAHYAFELIPQKRNKLYSKNIAFTESSEAFEERLKDEYLATNKQILKAAQPEVYNIPFIEILKKDETYIKERTTVIIPFNIFLNPFKKYFQRNFSLQQTEVLARIYINLMLNTTLLLAILFMAFQTTEYFISPVNINTGVYGSTFYMITGLHGAHVFIGTCFLFYCRLAVADWQNTKNFFFWLNKFFLYVLELLSTIPLPKTLQIIFLEIFFRRPTRLDALTDELNHVFRLPEVEELPGTFVDLGKLTDRTSHFNNYGKYGIESFESAAWYWHFVDVVWIFVFGFVYVWSHLTVLNLQ